jgi:hypothetical protein
VSLWPWWTPIIAIIVVITAAAMPLDSTLVTICGVALIGAVIASVHRHDSAEHLRHRH